MVLELQGADGMRDPFYGIGLAMGVIVHRVDAPCITGMGVACMKDAVHDRVAQVHIGRSHVDLCPQNAGTVRKFAGPHTPEEVKVFLGRPVAERALRARLGQGSAVFADLLRGEVVHIGLAFLDQLFRPCIQLPEIVRCVIQVPAPIETEPTDTVLDGVDILHVFFGRICVVEAEMAASAVISRQPEIETDGLGVTDVEVAVGLGRKSGDDVPVLAGPQILVNDGADEVGRLRRLGCSARLSLVFAVVRISHSVSL